MEDYKINIVSEHLKDRHPFNEVPFNERYDNSEVSVSHERFTTPSSTGPFPNSFKYYK
jgi:hypothetical protein